MLINQELADEIESEHGREGLDELICALQCSQLAVEGLETAVVKHFTNRTDLFYAPLYNTSIAIN